MSNPTRIFIGGLNAESFEAPDSSKSFVSRISAGGFHVVDNIEDAELFVCVDFSEESFEKALQHGLVPKKSVLICFEPLVVWPKNTLKSKDNFFSLIIRIGRSKNEYSDAICWPQQWNLDRFKILSSHQRSDQVVLINGNKLSLIKGELYSLRRQCISKIKEIDVYGTSWDISFLKKSKWFGALIICIGGKKYPRISSLSGFFKKYPQWKGTPKDKLLVMRDYKISLVIENSSEFLTEKLFDSFFAGCIPVYVGPDISDFGIPRELVVQVEPNIDDISKGIEDARKMDYERWSIACGEWLASPQVKSQWSVDSVFEEIIEKIKNFVSLDIK